MLFGRNEPHVSDNVGAMKNGNYVDSENVNRDDHLGQAKARR